MTKKNSFLLSIFTFLCLGTFPLSAHSEDISKILADCFPKTHPDNIKISELKGGLSQTSLYKVEANDKLFVLRILQPSQVNGKDSLELFCLKKASELGISPKIHYTSSDGNAVLMEFVQGKTLSMAQANIPENVIKLGKTFRTAHQMSGHPTEGESLLSKAQRCSAVINFKLVPNEQIIHAHELIQKYSQKLKEYKYEKVHVHGDLNPRNIFLKENQVYLIDWADTTLEDPFYDLAYFSLMLCYDESNEELLLKSYLGRNPTEEEKLRYNLHKKIHLAFWSMTNIYLTHMELQKHPEQKIASDNTPKSREFYLRTFSDYLEEIPAQYFYDLSRICYQLSLPDCEK